MIDLDLSQVPTEALRAELARRRLASGRRDETEIIEQRMWVCKCGNKAYGGEDLSKVFAQSGRVWCRVCYPSTRLEFYGRPGRPKSVPMVEHPSDKKAQ